MSKSNEFLSNLLDDRCSCDELDQLLDDKNSSNNWYRYSLVSAILKNESSVALDSDFCQSVSAKIALEPAIIATQASRSAKSDNALEQTTSNIFAFGRYASGMAIAASVAFATFFSINQLQSSDLNHLDQGAVATSDVSNSVQNTDSVAFQQSKNLPNTLEQSELEVFNALFLKEAKRSERGAYAPAGGEYIKTIRFSAEQWQKIVEKAMLQKAELEAAKQKAEQSVVEPAKTEQE